MQEPPPLYWPIPRSDPPIIGNAESPRNIHLPAAYLTGSPPLTQQAPDQLKCQLNYVNELFRTGNLTGISNTEFLDNAKCLFVEGRRWCHADPTKFDYEYKKPLCKLADSLSMYFPDGFSKGEFEDILS